MRVSSSPRSSEALNVTRRRRPSRRTRRRRRFPPSSSSPECTPTTLLRSALPSRSARLRLESVDARADSETPPQQDDGSYAIALPIPGSTKIPILDTVFDYGAFVREAIESPKFGAGTEVLAASEYISYDEIAKHLAEGASLLGKLLCFFVLSLLDSVRQDCRRQGDPRGGLHRSSRSRADGHAPLLQGLWMCDDISQATLDLSDADPGG